MANITNVIHSESGTVQLVNGSAQIRYRLREPNPTGEHYVQIDVAAPMNLHHEAQVVRQTRNINSGSWAIETNPTSSGTLEYGNDYDFKLRDAGAQFQNNEPLSIRFVEELENGGGQFTELKTYSRTVQTDSNVGVQDIPYTIYPTLSVGQTTASGYQITDDDLYKRRRVTITVTYHNGTKEFTYWVKPAQVRPTFDINPWTHTITPAESGGKFKRGKGYRVVFNIPGANKTPITLTRKKYVETSSGTWKLYAVESLGEIGTPIDADITRGNWLYRAEQSTNPIFPTLESGITYSGGNYTIQEADFTKPTKEVWVVGHQGQTKEFTLQVAAQPADTANADHLRLTSTPTIDFNNVPVGPLTNPIRLKIENTKGWKNGESFKLSTVEEIFENGSWHAIQDISGTTININNTHVSQGYWSFPYNERVQREEGLFFNIRRNHRYSTGYTTTNNAHTAPRRMRIGVEYGGKSTEFILGVGISNANAGGGNGSSTGGGSGGNTGNEWRNMNYLQWKLRVNNPLTPDRAYTGVINNCTGLVAGKRYEIEMKEIAWTDPHSEMTMATRNYSGVWSASDVSSGTFTVPHTGIWIARRPGRYHKRQLIVTAKYGGKPLVSWTLDVNDGTSSGGGSGGGHNGPAPSGRRIEISGKDTSTDPKIYVNSIQYVASNNRDALPNTDFPANNRNAILYPAQTLRLNLDNLYGSYNYVVINASLRVDYQPEHGGRRKQFYQYFKLALDRNGSLYIPTSGAQNYDNLNISAY